MMHIAEWAHNGITAIRDNQALVWKPEPISPRSLNTRAVRRRQKDGDMAAFGSTQCATKVTINAPFCSASAQNTPVGHRGAASKRSLLVHAKFEPGTGHGRAEKIVCTRHMHMRACPFRGATRGSY